MHHKEWIGIVANFKNKMSKISKLQFCKNDDKIVDNVRHKTYQWLHVKAVIIRFLHLQQ